MPLFFFNFTSQDEISIDYTGTEFPSLEAAYLSTCTAILDIAYEKLQARQDPEKDAFEIVDANRTVLMQVPFVEVLRPRRVSSAAALRDETNRLTRASQLLLARSKALKAELCMEIERTRRLSDTINANLAQLSARPVW
jgi:hypothetical protein